jgi:hypothetical protein
VYVILLIDYCRDRISLLMYLLSLTTRGTSHLTNAVMSVMLPTMGTLIVLLPFPLFISEYPIFYFDIPCFLEKYLCFLVKTYGLLKKFLCFLGSYTPQRIPSPISTENPPSKTLILSELTIFYSSFGSRSFSAASALL